MHGENLKLNCNILVLLWILLDLSCQQLWFYWLCTLTWTIFHFS